MLTVEGQLQGSVAGNESLARASPRHCHNRPRGTVVRPESPELAVVRLLEGEILFFDCAQGHSSVVDGPMIEPKFERAPGRVV